MIKNLIKCNKCGVHNCEIYKKIVDSSNCQYFKPMRPFRQPLIMYLLSKDSQVDKVHKLLSMYGLRLQELAHEPYFMLKLEG